VVGIDAEQLPDPVHHMDQALPVRQVGAEEQVPVAAGRDLQHPGRAVHGDRAPIGATLDRFDPRQRPDGKEGPDGVPVVAGQDRQPQREPAVGDEPVSAVPAVAELGRRRAEHLPHGPVELPQTPEPGGEGDVEDREVGVVQEATGEVRPPGPSQLVGACPQVLEEQSAQVPR
jgi:hypothetical protein